MPSDRPGGNPPTGAGPASSGPPRTPEILDPAECRRLLGTGGRGHLGYTDKALPAIAPASFTVHDGHVVIPLPVRSPVADAVRGAVVAFEVDAYRPEEGTGWSVTVVGPARVVVDSAGRDELDALGPVAARPPAGRWYASVRIGMIHGWRSSAPEERPVTGR